MNTAQALQRVPTPKVAPGDDVRPPRRGWWRWLRIPVLVLSILFLFFSMALAVIAPFLQRVGLLPSPLTLLFVGTEAQAARPATDGAASLAYAARLRADAQRLAQEGDLESAVERLDQAVPYDPHGDRSEPIERLRLELNARRSDPNHPPGGNESR